MLRRQCEPTTTQFQANFPIDQVFERVAKALEEARDWQNYHSGGFESPVIFEFMAWPESVRTGGLLLSRHTQYSHSQRFALKLQCNFTQSSLANDFHYDASVLDQTQVEFLARGCIGCVG